MPVRFTAAVAVLLLASCATADTATTVRSTTSEPVVEVGDVTLTRSGGIAGSVTTVEVRNDGSVTVLDESHGPRQSILPEAELATLHRLVRSPDFAALLDTYVPPDGVCCDFFFYEVTATVGDSVITTTTADTVETPVVLQQVIDLLSGLMP